jgi:hypothetical protein
VLNPNRLFRRNLVEGSSAKAEGSKAEGSSAKAEGSKALGSFTRVLVFMTEGFFTIAGANTAGATTEGFTIDCAFAGSTTEGVTTEGATTEGATTEGATTEGFTIACARSGARSGANTACATGFGNLLSFINKFAKPVALLIFFSLITVVNIYTQKSYIYIYLLS